ncbi:MAG: carboxypeptidase regulatory-like domain-containing protein, partial [Planctomycetes bacterium]|nr:carboxypeptidase regulatory-like domain-containing protein [Planctomycetota bacterium]
MTDAATSEPVAGATVGEHWVQQRSVTTDDEGRYVVPDLPDATYDVWVRGYGLVDSEKLQVSPGAVQDLAAVVAPDAAAAAHYYPAGYWFSMIEVPEKGEFPGTGADGNGISPNVESQAQWIQSIKTGNCVICHQLGNKATREIPDLFGEFESTVAAWERRILSGQAGGQMSRGLTRIGSAPALAMFADWTDRVTAGELPAEAPPRPEGEERNVVITQWDWADPQAYLHDEVSTDKRDPTVNAYGPIYGATELSRDYVPSLDPVAHIATQIPIVPVRDNADLSVASGPPVASSPYWGDEAIWDSKANAHNPMLDGQARLWLTTRVREADTPAFCRAGSDHPSAQVFPVERSGRQLSMYDPSTEAFTLIDT